MLINLIEDKLRNYPRLYGKAKDIFGWLRSFFYLFINPVYTKCFISARLGLKKSLGRPVLLTLEPTNICNLRCSVCETGSGKLNRESRMMKFEEFKHIMDQYDKSLRMLYLYFMGEPFLNRDIYRMTRYAADKGLYVSLCTNGEFIEPEELVRSGMADVQFQIGGMTQEIHNIYRKEGDLKKTLGNLEKTVGFKKKYIEQVKKNKHPLKISLGLILMKQNEHQIEEFKKMAKRIGVDGYQVISPCVRNMEQAKELLPVDKRYWLYDSDNFKKGKLRMKNPPKNYCEWLYSTVTIHSNGDVVPCCRDAQGEYVLGNIFKDNIYTIWNNEKYQEIRKSAGSGRGRCALCNLCEGYAIPTL